MPRRIFFVYDVPNERVRGEHSHKACAQFLVAIAGQLSVVVDDGRIADEVRLDRPDIGLLGYVLNHIGIDYNYVSNEIDAWVTVIVMDVWHWTSLVALLCYAGLKSIPEAYYQAAQIDGAGRIRQFFSITIPQLKYTIITSSTLILVGSLTYFDLIFVLTGGGPGNSTRILPLDMYLTGFRSYDMGQASSIAVILVVVGLGLGLALNRLSGAASMESQQAGL